MATRSHAEIDEEAAQLLEAGLRVLQKNDWVQMAMKTRMNSHYGFCSVGALREASRVQKFSPAAKRRAYKALAEVAVKGLRRTHIGRFWLSQENWRRVRDMESPIMSWNDYNQGYGDGSRRTKRQIFNGFRKAIKALRTQENGQKQAKKV